MATVNTYKLHNTVNNNNRKPVINFTPARCKELHKRACTAERWGHKGFYYLGWYITVALAWDILEATPQERKAWNMIQ